MIQPSTQTLQLSAIKQFFNNHFVIINLDFVLKNSFCYLPCCKTPHVEQITAILHNFHFNWFCSKWQIQAKIIKLLYHPKRWQMAWLCLFLRWVEILYFYLWLESKQKTTSSLLAGPCSVFSAPSHLVSCCWRMCLTAWARVKVFPVP